jgi:hypothetical protein
MHRKTEVFIGVIAFGILIGGSAVGVYWSVNSIPAAQTKPKIIFHQKFKVGDRVLILDINTHGRIEKRYWDDKGWVVRYFDKLNQERFAGFSEEELGNERAPDKAEIGPEDSGSDNGS